MLVPDELQMTIYHAEIEPHLREGYAMHFGLFTPPENIDIVLSVPASLGEVLRERCVRGEGVFGHFGVHQDYSGHARQIAMALAKGMGLLRFGSCECTFGEEVAVNLFAETAGLGAIMKYLLTAYEVLVEAGYSAESAYSETFYELQFFAEYLCKSKLGDTQFGSPTSTYLILRRSGEVVDDHVREQMRAMLKRIESGELVRDWNLEQTAGTPVFNQLKREIAEHPIREVEALFLERKEKTGW
jgi:ketol-acid reductoisomerase